MKELRGKDKADVAIAGGGLSGLSIALLLSRAGLRVALLEAQTLGSGISSRCMGAVYASEEEAEKHGRIIQTSMRAVQAVKELAVPFGLWRQAELYRLENGTEKASLHGACGVIQPARYMQLLVQLIKEQGAVLYENSRVIAMESNEFHTEKGTVHAPYLIVATGYPILNILGWYFLYLNQCEYDVVRLRGTAPHGVIVDEEGRMLLIPQSDGALLRCESGVVGERHNMRRAEQVLLRVQSQTGMFKEGRWRFGQEVCTPDGLPVIGTYGRKTPNLLVAAGYAGRGIAGSMTAAHSIASHILGLPDNDYEVYSPRRLCREWHTPVRTAYRYAKSILLHAQAPRCPHMHCRLVHNPHTRLWECPCHGSCFDDIGHVMNAPAVHDAVLRSRK